MGNESAREEEDVGELSIRAPLVTSRTHGIVYRGSDVAGSLRAEPLIINYDVDYRNFEIRADGFIVLCTVSSLLETFDIMTCKAKRLPI